MPTLHSYRLFGLTLSSALELPELIPAVSDEVPDVVIELGKVASQGEADQTPQPIEGGSAINVEGVARFAIRGGKRITVDALAGAPGRNVRLYLLGSAMGMLLHQRGILPLHANAVEVDGRAFAFMGPSGAGKSTLAAWFHDQGYRIVTDDVCVVRFGPDGQPIASPGLPRLRLWTEALEASGRQASGYRLSYVGDKEFDKFDVPIGVASIAGADAKLAAVYLLEQGERLTISRLRGIEAAEAVFANTYRGGYLSPTGHVRLHWEACVRLIRTTPIYLCERSWGLDQFSAQAQRLVAHAACH